jgi:hypothetical protein
MKMVLIKQNQRDLLRLREDIRKLKARNGPRQYIGESKRRIREILKCNSILQAAA